MCYICINISGQTSNICFLLQIYFQFNHMRLRIADLPTQNTQVSKKTWMNPSIKFILLNSYSSLNLRKQYGTCPGCHCQTFYFADVKGTKEGTKNVIWEHLYGPAFDGSQSARKTWARALLWHHAEHGEERCRTYPSIQPLKTSLCQVLLVLPISAEQYHDTQSEPYYQPVRSWTERSISLLGI